MKGIKTAAWSLWVTLAISIAISIDSAFATTSGGSSMPWEGPLDKIMTSISGPVAKVIAVLIIVGTGFAIAYGEGGQGTQKALKVVMGIAIAFAASSFFLTFFGFAGGVIF